MVGKTDWTRKEIEKSNSFKTAMENIVENSNRTYVSKGTKNNYICALQQYLQFVNGEKKLEKTITLDDLIIEAQENIKTTKCRIKQFFNWSQGEKGEPTPDYEPRGKGMKKTSAFMRAFSQVKGFYTNNSIIFGKWKTPNIKNMVKEGIKNDVNVPFFKLDKKRKIFLDRKLLNQFLANLKFRDQAIFLAGLSSSQDSGDLFKLNIGDIRNQKNKDRFFWEGQRTKTGVRFKTFFSVEATDYVRRYIEQERQDAKDDEPLFLTAGRKGKSRRMDASTLGDVFLVAAKRMGVELTEGCQNPFRPKRLRHIFRTACTHAHIDEGYINAFMGHQTSVSQAYLEKDIMILELEFAKAEPYLTVYEGVGTEGIQIEITEWKAKVTDLRMEVDDLKTTLTELQSAMEQKMEKIVSHIFGELTEEDLKVFLKEQKERVEWKRQKERERRAEK